MSPAPHDQRTAAPRTEPEELLPAALALLARVDEVVLGKQDVTREVFTALLAGGHVLLEDIPGVGKTTLALAFSKLMGLECTRVQFTPDVTPSDVVGFSVYKRDTGSFEYRPGAVFCNLLLADELNRTSPKTQSALLEAMEERSVTVDGTTRPLPDPFFVIATQNPLGSAGTQPLPLSQLDRFAASMTMGYPSHEDEVEMAKGASGTRRTDRLARIASPEALRAMQRAASSVFVSDDVYDYLVRLVRATRADRRLEVGASPRATVALVGLAKACAWLRGGDFATPADVELQFRSAVRHRVMLSPDARLEGVDVDGVLSSIAEGVSRPRLPRSARPARMRRRDD